MARAMNVASCLWLAIFLIIFITTDARQIIVPQGMPDIGIPMEHRKHDVGMIPFPKPNIYKTKHRIFLGLIPLSADIITLRDGEIRVFLYKKNAEWIEIKNVSLKRLRSDITIDVLHSGHIVLTIDPSEINPPCLLRIFLIADITETYPPRANYKRTISYTDVYINP